MPEGFLHILPATHGLHINKKKELQKLICNSFFIVGVAGFELLPLLCLYINDLRCFCFCGSPFSSQLKKNEYDLKIVKLI